VPLTPPPPPLALQAEDSDDEPPDEASSAADYLTPFLPPGLGAGGMTREQCLAVRERCLRALKDRLVQRANIIQVSSDGRALLHGQMRKKAVSGCQGSGVLACACGCVRACGFFVGCGCRVGTARTALARA
jgi:hypothetical protein